MTNTQMRLARHATAIAQQAVTLLHMAQDDDCLRIADIEKEIFLIETRIKEINLLIDVPSEMWG